MSLQESPQQWERRCLSKAGHRTEMRARWSAFTQYNKPSPPLVPALYIYSCDICGEWHLTKKPNGSVPVTQRSPYDMRFRETGTKNPARASRGASARTWAFQKGIIYLTPSQSEGIYLLTGLEMPTQARR